MRRIRTNSNRLVAFSSLISRSVRLTWLFKMPQPWTDTYSFQTDFYFILYELITESRLRCVAPLPHIHIPPLFLWISYSPRRTSIHKKIPISAPTIFECSDFFFCIRSNAISREQYRLNCVICMCVCLRTVKCVCASCSVVRTKRWIFISSVRILHKPSPSIIIMRNRSGKVSIVYVSFSVAFSHLLCAWCSMCSGTAQRTHRAIHSTHKCYWINYNKRTNLCHTGLNLLRNVNKQVAMNGVAERALCFQNLFFCARHRNRVLRHLFRFLLIYIRAFELNATAMCVTFK